MNFRSNVSLATLGKLRCAVVLTATIAASLLCSHLPAAIGPKGETAIDHAPAARGEVIISDIAGQAIPGVAVMNQPRPEMVTPENLSETTATTTNASGKFMAPAREVGGGQFVLRKPAFEAVALDAAQPAPRQITLRPGRTVTGQVFTAGGEPIAGALVGPVSYTPTTVNPTDRNRGKRNQIPRQAARTEATGAFHLDSLPLESVVIQFSAPGHTPRLVTFNASTSEQKISMQTGGATITGTVVGSKDRAPQPAVVVEASGNNLLLYARTDPQGTYTFDNMPTGTYTLRPAGGGPLSGTQSQSYVVDISQASQVENLPLVLNQGIMLAGRAIDMKTSLGLAGINITLAGYAGTGARAVLTDPDGSFRFDNLDSLQDAVLRFDPVQFVYLLPGGAYRDYFDISKAGDTNFDLTTLTLPLHRRLEVTGKVRDAAGVAAPDVEIRLQSLDVLTSAPAKSGPGALTYSAYSNAKGEFRVGVYPAGEYKVWAQQDALVSQVESVEAYTTAPVPTVELRMDQAAQLGGLVTDARDGIVTGAVVIAWPVDTLEPEEEPIPGRDNYEYAKTDKSGHFVLSGLRGEPLIFRASHPSFVQSTRLTIDPAAMQGATSDSIVLKFPAGGEFAVTVSDDAGQTLSGAEVQLDYTTGLDGQRVRVMTDSYGRAFVAALPADRLEKIVVSHPVFAPFESEAPINLPQNNYKVTLKKRGSIAAHIKGASPVAGVPVEIFLLHAPLIPSAGNVPPEQGFDQTARASVVAGQALFPNLPPGWYKAAYADSGAYAESKVVRMEAGSGDHNVELTLPQGNHLTGTVKDKLTGEGIAGANLTLRPAVDSQIVTERAQQNVTTGDGGAFELYNVGAGRLHAKVVTAGYPDYEKDVDFTPGETLDIELSNLPSILEGRVTVASSPVEGALLVLSKSGGDHSPVATAVTDEAGGYLLEGFSAGSYILTVEAPIGAGENISRKSVPVQIDDAQATQNVNFEALVAVRGKVRLGGKLPERGGAPVVVMFSGMGSGAESKMVTITQDGTYAVQLEPGKYNVSLEDRVGRPVDVKAGAGTGQTLNLDF